MTPLVAVKPKAMLRSKTFWINLVVAVLALIAELQQLLPSFTDIISIPPELGRWLLFATAVLNIILRRFSDAPARFSPQGETVVLERANG